MSSDRTSPNPYRDLPRVDDVARSDAVAALDVPESVAVEAARDAIAAARDAITRGESAWEASAITADAARRARLATTPSLRPVINATGVIVHTNLGRAPLSAASLEAALGYCNLEYDLDAGQRGSRRAHVASLLRSLSGAEAALVVNNNAAAVVLMLAALCRGRRVVISRGELVEIGGSFRVPEIMEASGAVLQEVGTTNKTYARDYDAAIGDDTAAILRVHPSNYQMRGFTHAPTTSELAEVARARGVLLLHDVGAATFGALPEGLEAGVDVREELAAGVDLLCFSGDKVLGGPQAGIVLGRGEHVDALARHPLARAFRADKLTLAALEHTLLAHRLERPDDVPVARMLSATCGALDARAEALIARLREAPAAVEVVACRDAVGGGSHPDDTLEGRALAIAPRSGGAAAVQRALRALPTPIVAVVAHERVLIHLRTVDPARDDALAAGILAALGA